METSIEKRLLQAGYQVFSTVGNDSFDLLAGLHPHYFRTKVEKLIHRPKTTNDAHSVEKWEIRVRLSGNCTKRAFLSKFVDLVMAEDKSKKEFAIIPVSRVPRDGLVSIYRGSLNYRYFNTYVALKEALTRAKKLRKS